MERMFRSVTKIEKQMQNYGVNALRLRTTLAAPALTTNSDSTDQQEEGRDLTLKLKQMCKHLCQANHRLFARCCFRFPCASNAGCHDPETPSPRSTKTNKMASKKRAVLQMAFGYAGAWSLVWTPYFLPSLSSMLQNLTKTLWWSCWFPLFLCKVSSTLSCSWHPKCEPRERWQCSGQEQEIAATTKTKTTSIWHGAKHFARLTWTEVVVWRIVWEITIVQKGGLPRRQLERLVKLFVLYLKELNHAQGRQEVLHLLSSRYQRVVLRKWWEVWSAAASWSRETEGPKRLSSTVYFVIEIWFQWVVKKVQASQYLGMCSLNLKERMNCICFNEWENRN